MYRKSIPGFPGYFVDQSGKVYSGNRELRPVTMVRGGYQKVTLCRHGERFQKTVHSLVLLTFMGPRPPTCEGRHIDGDPANNQLANLRWGTRSENVRDAILHRTHFTPFKKPSKLSPDEIDNIRCFHDSGISTRKIADFFDVGKSTVWMIVAYQGCYAKGDAK